MLKDILNFPDNRAIFDGLAKLLKEQRAVAFVGAGASAGLYPMWNRFVQLLADHALAEGKADLKDAERWKKDTGSRLQQRIDTIVRRLGEALYRDFLKATFGPARGADGRRYTAAHAALLRLPFRGYVTTNYDPALEEARVALRPDTPCTGTPTWQDEDEVYLWRTGDVFKRPCPILWLHGYWQRPDGIVLNSGEYRQAYKPGIYLDTFKELWIREHLVLIGFGFNDPQFTFMVGEFLRDIADANAAPRHIAILGWPIPDDGATPDPEEIKEKRDSLEADYHLRALFYPVKNGDHSALHVLLEGIVLKLGTADLSRPPSGSATLGGPLATGLPTGVPPSAAPLPSCWVHETTNDDKFTGRQDEFYRLDRWVRDDAVRVVGVCAVGGTGKTALVGHWLKNTAAWRSRPFVGLFAWSFYQNRDTSEFIEALLQWSNQILGTPKPDEEKEFLDAAAQLLRKHVLLLVLDGLEMLQEWPENARYGSFLDAGLRKLLHALCEDASSHSLAVLTSRLVFADLERHLGTAFHQLELPGLPPDQGARLLDDLRVRGQASDREEVSRRLEGNPFALRVFAESLPDSDRAQPREFLDLAFNPNALPPGAPLSDKLHRLLGFYDRKLPQEHVRLLSIVALFRSPQREETLLRLARGLFADAVPPLPDNVALSRALTVLHSRGILNREPIEGGYSYACHPILRDHFRAVLLGSGVDTARRAADLLKGQPSKDRPQSLKEIEPVLLAIEILLDAGEFKAADELYRGRLKQESGFTMFQLITALPEGLAAALGFVRDGARRQECEKQLSRIHLSYYLNEVGLCASLGGRYSVALRNYSDAEKLDREMNDTRNLGIGLRNKTELHVFLGQLADAEAAAAEALRLAIGARDEREIINSHPYHGWAAALAGRVRHAAEDFARANELLAKQNEAKDVVLYSIRGIQSAELLLRSGHTALAARRTTANLRICQRNEWNHDNAYCHWVLGTCALAEGRIDDAVLALEIAEPIFHRGQFLFWLARLHITSGALALAQQNAPGAFHRVAEALALAQPRGMKLVHADALVLRGRARLLEAKPDHAIRALDDATDGLRLARDCGYAWAERDALFLEADARTVLAGAYDVADPARAICERTAVTKVRVEAEAIAAKLVLTEEDLAQADLEADVWLAEWERQKAQTAKDGKRKTGSH